MCLSHTSLLDYYNTVFQLMQHHKYSLSEIDGMIPWEKDVYISMLAEFIREQKEEMARQQHG